MHPDLFPFQRTGAEWLAGRGQALLADEMGVGKTSQAIAAADLSKAKTILVLCPGIARVNWMREISTWQTRQRSIGAISTGRDRPNEDAVVCSYSLARTIGPLQHMLKRDWDVLIIDEAQALKSDVALVTRCVYGNTFDRRFGLASKARRVWLLSGTIMPSHPGEIWTHCASLFPEITHGRSYQQWINDYCDIDPFSKRVVGGNARRSELAPMLRPHVLRRSAKQVFPDMPPLRFSQVTVRPEKLPPKSREIAETEMVVEAAIALNAVDKSDEARRLMATVDEMHLSSLVRWTGVAKAPAVGEYIAEEIAGGLDRCVIFALHREVFGVLEEILPGAISIHGGTSLKRRQEAIDGFQGRIPGFTPKILVCHLSIASTALTLTAGCHVEFAEQPWVPATILQAAKRCHRIGQTRPVLARVFSMAGSVDEKIGRIVVRKARQISEFDQGLLSP